MIRQKEVRKIALVTEPKNGDKMDSGRREFSSTFRNNDSEEEYVKDKTDELETEQNVLCKLLAACLRYKDHASVGLGIEAQAQCRGHDNVQRDV
jgi:hypothetical protein